MAHFLDDLLIDGRIVMSSPPSESDDQVALTVLRRAYETDALSIAGPVLALDETIALAAARLLQWSAWYFLHPGLTMETLRMPNLPTVPEHHLSGDLCLRFLPTLYRRARTLMPNDTLPSLLQQTLREWPLSGVLSDIVEPPLTPIDFGQHPGLNFRYAERLAKHERAAWVPQGHALQYVELVWHELGKKAPALPAITIQEPSNE